MIELVLGNAATVMLDETRAHHEKVYRLIISAKGKTWMAEKS